VARAIGRHLKPTYEGLKVEKGAKEIRIGDDLKPTYEGLKGDLSNWTVNEIPKI